MTDNTPADPSVFEDTDRREITITEDELLGTHTFEDVLYTGDTEVVNVLTGDTPDQLDRSVEEAKDFAERTSEDPDSTPRVAKALPPEAAVESRAPFVSSAFFHMDITGGMDWHTVFRKAYESDSYIVTHDDDYTTGTLTITVKKANETE